jgi:hypothetical protein
MCWPGPALLGGLAGCDAMSRRVHSRYQRWLADTVSGGQQVLIHLTPAGSSAATTRALYDVRGVSCKGSRHA